jgi:hypothetical protein
MVTCNLSEDTAVVQLRPAGARHNFCRATVPHEADAACRSRRSGGRHSFAVRQPYTDRDEVLFQAVRPIILNAIEDVIVRPDLADRAIFVSLPHLQEERRRTEKEIWCDLSRPNRTSSARCWMLQAMDCVSYPSFDWNSCHGWRTLHSGRQQRPRLIVASLDVCH